MGISGDMLDKLNIMGALVDTGPWTINFVI
jgi:hypothetical protein